MITPTPLSPQWERVRGKHITSQVERIDPMKADEKRNKLLRGELRGIVAKLRKDYKPQQIILFGSLANGTVGECSDIDLVIIKDTKKRFVERLKEVALLCDYTVGVDFWVYTPEEFFRAVEQKEAFFIDEIIHKGKVLWRKIPSPNAPPS